MTCSKESNYIGLSHLLTVSSTQSFTPPTLTYLVYENTYKHIRSFYFKVVRSLAVRHKKCKRAERNTPGESLNLWSRQKLKPIVGHYLPNWFFLLLPTLTYQILPTSPPPR